MERKRPVFRSLGTLVLAGCLVGTFSVTVHAGTDLIAKGEAIYAEKKCAVCHMINGKGGKAGGDLSLVGAKREERWLREFMKAPKAVLPKAKMLPFKGSDEELEALILYLASLK